MNVIRCPMTPQIEAQQLLCASKDEVNDLPSRYIIDITNLHVVIWDYTYTLKTALKLLDDLFAIRMLITSAYDREYITTEMIEVIMNIRVQPATVHDIQRICTHLESVPTPMPETWYCERIYDAHDMECRFRAGIDINVYYIEVLNALIQDARNASTPLESQHFHMGEVFTLSSPAAATMPAPCACAMCSIIQEREAKKAEEV